MSDVEPITVPPEQPAELRSCTEDFICPRGPGCQWCHGSGHVCECNPDQEWDPDNCSGAGMPCGFAHLAS